ncbi:hypothetical protein, partial [Histidinibacterium aquaticum]
MTRLALVLYLVLAATAAGAQTVQDQIVSQLRAQGFTSIEASRTLLGRVILHAQSPSYDRELVFNPTTGEILRDLTTIRRGDDSRPRVLNPRSDDDDDDRRGSAASSNSGNG